MDGETTKVFEELKAMVLSNSEQSNARIGRVNEMIGGVITIVTTAVEKQKVVEVALNKSQELCAQLAKTNESLIDELKEIRKRCAEIQKDNQHLHELLRSRGSMVSIDNKQM